MSVWIRVPRNSFEWLLKIVAVILQATSVLPMISVKFGTVTSPSGAPWCSLDLPSMVMQMMSGNMIATCALECLKNECCMFYQFKANSYLCELFEYTTTNFTVIPSCSSQRTTMRGGQVVTPRSVMNPNYQVDRSNGLCNIGPLFYIVSYSDNRMVADIASGGGLVINAKVSGKTSQLWYFDKQQILRSAVNDNGVVGSSTGDTQLLVAPFNGGDSNQQWKWLPGPVGQPPQMSNSAIGMCFAVRGRATSEGSVMITWNCNTGFHWTLAQ